MMQDARKTADVGVIIGRFQVDNLHEAHQQLIAEVALRHKKVIVLLGIAPVCVSTENPLDFEARYKMLRDFMPRLLVAGVKDRNCDVAWSTAVDEAIDSFLSPTQTALLYGSRDSFIKHYTGRWDTQELESAQTVFESGSLIRDRVRVEAASSADFRRGVIWAAHNQYPKVVPCVDIAIFSEDKSQMLLAQKTDETTWRFVGGHCDPASYCYEDDATRELMEETGGNAEFTYPEYHSSHIIDDWRYTTERDKIKTILFQSTLMWGKPVASDDIARLQWFDTDGFLQSQQELWNPTHIPLFLALRGE